MGSGEAEMLFTELKKIREEDVRARLEEQLRARGVDPAILSQELGAGVTVEQLLSDVVDELIAEAADANRESFRARQRIGFAQARESGRAVGRPTRRADDQFERVRAMYEEKEISGAEAAKLLGVARGTFYRWLKETSENAGGGAINAKFVINHVFIMIKSCKKRPNTFGRFLLFPFVFSFVSRSAVPARGGRDGAR